MKVRTLIAIATALALNLMTRPVEAQECVGDCNGNGGVTVCELVLGVNIILGHQPIEACEVFDCEGNGTAQVNCLIRGLLNAFSGCPVEACALEPGTYTLTQTADAMSQVGTLPPITIPAGGSLVLDVQAASPPDCVHDAVVPFPGGFTSSAYCIPGTEYTAQLTQLACGVGRIASNGSGDYTITEIADSSSQAECDNQQECVAGVDNRARVDVIVGDGMPDECVSGQANVVLSLPIETLVWVDGSEPRACPDADGQYDPETDQLLARNTQLFDLTTDTATVDWMDLSGDGCTIAHDDPPLRYSNTGTCWDLSGQTLSIAASGALPAASPPLFDSSVTALIPYTSAAPAPPSGAACDAPPPIDFAGTTVRCLE